MLERFFNNKVEAEEELTFEKFLEEKFLKDPKKYARSAHKYLLDALYYFGEDKNGLPKIVTDEIFGMEEKIKEFIDILKAGAQGHDVRRRLLIFVGPVGTAKSTLVNILKRTLEKYSRTEEGALYAIKFCPIHENPLNLLNEEAKYEVKKEFGVEIEQSLCPVCQYKLEKDHENNIRDVKVKRIYLSEKKRIGIATFVPGDYNSQDASVLVGSENFVEIQKYGDSSHPLAWNFNGSLFAANRGLHEFIEMHKAKPDLLYPLLVLAQERQVKVDRFGMIDVDTVLIAHTNYTEYKKFLSKKENEALKDRSREIEWKYVLKVSDEEKIYKKMLGKTEFHLAPWSLRLPSMVAVLSRLSKERNAKYDRLLSMKIYNGELPEYNEFHFEEMKHENDGRSGISPRIVVDAISFASVDKKCVTPIDVVNKLQEVIVSGNVEIDKTDFDSILEMARNEYNKYIKDTVFKAFLGSSFEKEAQMYFEKYIEHASASLNNEKIRDPYTGKFVDFDEKYLRQVEETIGISKENSRDFRMKVLVKISHLSKKGEKLRYDSHPDLKKAIEKLVIDNRASFIRGAISSVVRDEEKQKAIEEAKGYLVKNEGFCENCATEAIDYVAWLLDRVWVLETE